MAARDEAAIKSKIREHLQLTLPECFIPELGEQKQGKVRSIYFSGNNVVMVTNDRVSAFDYILPNLIPFKGQVLNMISEWAFSQTKDIVPNALVENVDASVVVQKKMKNVGVELIVRGYLWGSMAAAYEKGDRTFCGLNVPEGFIRFQKFDTPVFTPTTKAEVGHDENMTLADMEALLGNDLAARARDTALKLYQRGSELMRKQGLILIDTKYEFGTDENGVLHVIDEANTPDCSRMCTVQEYEAKYPKIEAEMKSGQYKDVTELLKAKPEFKLKEFSKQYIRDALLEMGFDPTKDKEAPKLSDEQVVECAFRYISIYEQVTGNTFEFPSANEAPARRIVRNLQRAGIIKGCFVVILIDSEADLPQADQISSCLSTYQIPFVIRICSSRRDPSYLQTAIDEYNKSVEPILFVTISLDSDASLAGTVSYLSKFPVILFRANIQNAGVAPLGSSYSVIDRPENVARFAAQLFAQTCEDIATALEATTRNDISKEREADVRSQRTLR